MSKIKVKLCDNRCYCTHLNPPTPTTPTPLCGYLKSQCHLKRELEKKRPWAEDTLAQPFFKQKHLTSLILIIALKKEKGRKKENMHGYLYV